MSVEIASLHLKAKDRLDLAKKIHLGLHPDQVLRFLDTAGMTQEQLFAGAHIPVSTGRRRLAEDGFKEHESERIARIARIYDQAADLFEPPRATEWLLQPNPRLGGQTPFEVAGMELGAAEVEALLGRLAHGIY